MQVGLWNFCLAGCLITVRRSCDLVDGFFVNPISGRGLKEMAWVGWGWFCPHLLDNPKSPWKNKKSDFLKVHNEWGKFKNLGTSRTLFSCFFQVPFHNLGLKFNLIAYLSLLCFKNLKLDTATYCCTSYIFFWWNIGPRIEYQCQLVSVQIPMHTCRETHNHHRRNSSSLPLKMKVVRNTHTAVAVFNIFISEPVSSISYI